MNMPLWTSSAPATSSSSATAAHGQIHTTVAEILPEIDGDGPGIVDITGATYWHFDFALRILDPDSYEVDRSFAALIDMLEYAPTRGQR